MTEKERPLENLDPASNANKTEEIKPLRERRASFNMHEILAPSGSELNSYEDGVFVGKVILWERRGEKNNPNGTIPSSLDLVERMARKRRKLEKGRQK